MREESYIKNPEIFSVNRAPHSALFDAYGERTEHISLDGKWKIRYFESISAFDESCLENDYDVSALPEIETPSVLELNGYGQMQYVNTQYPWDGKEALTPPEVSRICPVAVYFKDISIKTAENAIITFYGVEKAYSLYVNGVFSGYSEDTFSAHHFDISSQLKEGVNRIAVLVFKNTSASWLEDQDFWRLSGIFRPAEIVLHPDGYIEDVKVECILEKGYRKGTLKVSVKTKAERVRLECGKSSAEGEKCAEISIENPLLWSAENPALYTLKVSALSCDGKEIESVDIKAGFKDVKIENGILKLNGKRIVFHGVNRHEWNEKTGRAITYEDMKKDILIMKRNNINALRTSHYPNRKELYDLCDEYGIYLIAEANLETHGTWQKMGKVAPDKNTLPDDNPLFYEAVLDRQKANYEAFKNHVSIIMWSIGNESFGGKTLQSAHDYYHSLSPLPVHYEGIFHDRRYNGTSDVESQMYTRVSGIKAFLEKDRSKPFIMCEYSHSMGNSNGGLMEYIRLERSDSSYQGGFIWDFIDQSLNDDGKKLYGGDYYDRPSDFTFCANGIVYADRKETAKMGEVKYAYQNAEINIDEEKIEVINRYLFTDLSEFECELEYLEEGRKIKGKKINLALAPSEKTVFSNPYKGKEDVSYSIRLLMKLKEDTSWAEKGHTVAHGEYYHIARTVLASENAAAISGDVNYGFEGKNYNALFDRTKGQMISIRAKGREVLKYLPYFSLYRAPVDNDKGSSLSFEFAPLLAEGKRARYENNNAILTLSDVDSYHIMPISRKNINAHYEFKKDFIKCTLTYNGPERYVPLFGMTFILDESFRKGKYLGLGPEANERDRKEGSLFSLWDIDAFDAMESYHVPQSSGWRMKTKRINLSGLVFEAENDMAFSLLPYTEEEIESAYHMHELGVKSKVVLTIAKDTSGVGGDDSWLSWPLEKDMYKIKEGESFTFYIYQEE